MSKLEKKLPEMYAQMHAEGAFKGDSWNQHLEKFARWAGNGTHYDDPYQCIFRSEAELRPILDYGCGPKGGLASDLHFKRRSGFVISYDPYVEDYNADPWKTGFKCFFTCDVLEHMTEEQISALLLRLRKHGSCKRIFAAVTCRAANKTLPNGLNAHLTIKPPEWWHGLISGTLSGVYRVEIADADLLTGEAVFALTKEDRGEDQPAS